MTIQTTNEPPKLRSVARQGALSWKIAAGIFILLIAVGLASDFYEDYRFKYSLSPAEHLREAKTTLESIPGLAYRHLSAIPSNSPEYREVPALLAFLGQQEKAAREKQETEAARRRPQIEQEKRDQDAQTSSYWPTTLRVDTDMDSFWLNGEERTCQTFPDNSGKVALVGCNGMGSHANHNIPVKFWGGINRNVVSDWRCRREGDDFVCRAIN